MPHFNDTELNRTIGLNLRAARERAGETQISASKKVDLSYQQIQKYEVGDNRITLALALELCKHYNADLSEIVPPNAMIDPELRDLVGKMSPAEIENLKKHIKARFKF